MNLMDHSVPSVLRSSKEILLTPTCASFSARKKVSSALKFSKMCHLLHLAATELLADDQCVIKLLKGLCLKHLGKIAEAEGHFNYIYLK